MRYLLDTNICIYLIKQKPQKVLDKFQSLAISDVGISSITVAELEYGDADNLERPTDNLTTLGSNDLLDCSAATTQFSPEYLFHASMRHLSPAPRQASLSLIEPEPFSTSTTR
jgi:hypothetical protein